MTMSLSEAAVLQKEIFLNEPEINQQFDSGTPTLDLIESGSEITDAVNMSGRKEGKYMVVMNETIPPGNRGVGGVYGDAYPGDADPTFQRLLYVNRDVFSTNAFNMFTMDRTDGGEKSTNDLMSELMSSTISRNRKVMNQKLLNDGTGRRCDVVTNGWDDGNQRLSVSSVRGIVKGDQIIPRNPTAGGFRTGTLGPDYPVTPDGSPAPLKVTHVDRTNKYLYLSQYDGSAVKEADGDALTNSDFNGFSVYSYDAQGKDPWGLRNYCRTGNPAYSGFNPASPTTLLTSETLLVDGLPGGIDRTDADNDWFQPIELNANGEPISLEDHIQEFLIEVEDRVGDDMPALLGITGKQVRQKLKNECARDGRTDYTARLRAPGDVSKKRKRYDAVVIDDLYVVADNDADPTEILISAPSRLFRTKPKPWTIETAGSPDGLYMRKTGLGLGRGIPEWDMYWTTQQQLCANSVLPNGAIYNILATK